MKSSRILYFIFALTYFSLSVNAAEYCACCAEPGQYSISVRKPTSPEIEILKAIRFATANLYTTAAFPENIKGINTPGDSYSVSGAFQNNLWKFDFTDDKNKNGSLLLPMPATITAFETELYDREEFHSAGPILYKEWRFKFKVRRGTGIFQTGIAPATEYFLVLQGRGNNCPDVTDFKHWRLEVTGKKAGYAFFGKLKDQTGE
jgi:hypothetical protein